MQYRTFGRLDWKPSALGFGIMRMPTIVNDPPRIDEAEGTRMLRWAIDHGVNYLDTAYFYHGGNSEVFLGRALQDGYRERIRLATKLPCGRVETTEDFDRILNEQLTRLQTDHIDFYLLHGLNAAHWARMVELRILEQAEKAIADGRVRYLGFSFHDKYEVFQEIVDAYDGWTMCQIQYNFMDEDRQAGKKGLQYAASKGLAVVVMEPLRGGALANPPEVVREIWAKAPRQRTPVEWALHWIWNQPEVSLLLSGMSTMEQVQQNVATASDSGVGKLTPEELAIFDQVRVQYQQLRPVPCTDCRYCQPCPSGVAIPRAFSAYNAGVMYNAPQEARRLYNFIDPSQRADQCTECGQCEEVCPQEIEIIDWLKKADQYFS